jgi:hypothetical protein
MFVVLSSLYWDVVERLCVELKFVNRFYSVRLRCFTLILGLVESLSLVLSLGLDTPVLVADHLGLIICSN